MGERVCVVWVEVTDAVGLVPWWLGGEGWCSHGESLVYLYSLISRLFQHQPGIQYINMKQALHNAARPTPLARYSTGYVCAI